MSTKKKLLEAAAGNAGEAVYVDDVFSTYLYTGNGTSDSSTNQIQNGLDLSGDGGLVWIKKRSGGTTGKSHSLYDTERGVYSRLKTDDNSAETVATDPSAIVFNSDGFTVQKDSEFHNYNGRPYVSWSFRKQRGFFDVVAYTGTGSAQNISHNLGSVPGMVIVKRRDADGGWRVYHRGVDATAPEDYYLALHSTDTRSNDNTIWNDTAPTSTEFRVGSADSVNASGGSYIAYLFAHDAQDFGTDSDESIIKCGSYTGNGSATGPEIDLGFEPQWLLIKRTDGTQYWNLIDVMRGMPAEGAGNDSRLFPNEALAESTGSNYVAPTPTGFKLIDGNTQVNGNGSPYIYVAIRRPHKPASELTANDVFSVKTYAATTTSASVTHDVAFDMEMSANRDVGTAKFHFVDQLRGINGVTIRSSNTSQELSYPTFWSRQNMYTMYAPSQFDSWWASSSGTQNHISYALKRAPGFFDIVAYTGTGSTLVLDHNLGVEPEFMIVKGRTITAGWHCYHKDVGNTKAVPLNSDGAESTSSFYWNNTSPTATQATLGAFTHYNVSNQTGILYLFATVAGISKVGSYSGTGSDVNVDCGFSSGARMVWVKRADSSGDWFVWDSVRGIVAGNDPYLRLNSETAEVTTTDYIDPLSTGFTITSSAPAALNASGGSYIFLAIA